jgi:hypothetical protein
MRAADSVEGLISLEIGDIQPLWPPVGGNEGHLRMETDARIGGRTDAHIHGIQSES